MWQISALNLSFIYKDFFLEIKVMDIFFFYLQVVVFILIAVAFLTLLERKTLGYAQFRKGPNKLGFGGLVQPFADAIKLFSKEEVFMVGNNFLLFFVSPFFSFFVRLSLWYGVVSLNGFRDFKLSILFFLACISVSVYGMILSGWSSNSKYALLGALRAVAQTISYEIVLSFSFVFFCFFFVSYNLLDLFVFQVFFFHVALMVFLFFIFFLRCVIETNRAPFDLSEGESELVSGFNVEYGGLKFALIFIAEYANIIWMRVVVVIIFLSSSFIFCFIFMVIMLVMIFLFFRASFPRFRYDWLIMITWKRYLFMVIFFYIFVFSIF